MGGHDERTENLSRLASIQMAASPGPVRVACDGLIITGITHRP